MVNKLSVKSLSITFISLLVVVALYYVYDAYHGESSFRENIVSIDTSKVTSISIFPKSFNHKEIKIYKEGSLWKINLASGKKVPVPFEKVQELFILLSSVKPLSVAAQSSNKWKDFNVDSSGTRVMMNEGSKNTLDMTIGKFTYQAPRSMSSYVRVAGDDNVYLVSGFLDMAFNHDADYFRDDNVVFDNPENWTKLTFTYPADSSFQLNKNNDRWTAAGKQVDSLKIFRYLETLSDISIPNFIDNPGKDLLAKFKYSLVIQTTKGTININSYEDTKGMAITSSQHPDTYFDGKKADAWKRIFISRKALQ